MRDLMKISSLLLFILLFTPFVVGGAFENIFFLIAIFLSSYWIISVGRFGSMILENNNSTYAKIFTILSRLVFISLTFHFLLLKFDNISILGLDSKTLLFLSDSLFYLSLIYVTLYSSFILTKLIGKKETIVEVVLTGLLFWLFPIGVWILQPRINNYIGNELE